MTIKKVRGGVQSAEEAKRDMSMDDAKGRRAALTLPFQPADTRAD